MCISSFLFARCTWLCSKANRYAFDKGYLKAKDRYANLITNNA